MHRTPKIPTIVGIVLVIALVLGVSYLVERVLRSPSQASVPQAPDDVKITNVTDKSFTVTWFTETPVTGSVTVSSPRKIRSEYYDDRDKTGKLGTYLSHSVTVRDATPATVYEFSIVSGGKRYKNGSELFRAQTVATLPVNEAGLDPAYGTVKDATGQPAVDTIVYLTVSGSQELSTLTNQSGIWLIPLNQVRTEDMTAFLQTLERMDESITARYDGLVSQAITDTLNDSPVPDMQLGKEYDFRRQQAKAAPKQEIAVNRTPTQSPASDKQSYPPAQAVLGEQSQKTHSVSITAPKSKSALTTTKPQFQGTGVPGKFVGLTIGTLNPITASVKVEANGLWSFTPPRALNEGDQSVTIASVNQSGKQVAMTTTFTILKSGTQVLGSATPSGTLTQTPTGTVSPTVTPSITTSPAPESTDSATPTPTEEIAGEPPPSTGSTLPTMGMLLLAIGLTMGGALIFLGL